jgi:type IV pilus assembly protein PilA
MSSDYSGMKSKQRGFTLIEVLIVIASIAILTTIAIVAINPSRSLAKARNGQRYADISTILSALYQYQLDHNGKIPEFIRNGEYEICHTGVACDTDAYIDLHELTDNQAYLVAIPRDPSGATETSSGYSVIKKKGYSRITIHAPYAELEEDIRVSR